MWLSIWDIILGPYICEQSMKIVPALFKRKNPSFFCFIFLFWKRGSELTAVNSVKDSGGLQLMGLFSVDHLVFSTFYCLPFFDSSSLLPNPLKNILGNICASLTSVLSRNIFGCNYLHCALWINTFPPAI